MNSGSTLRHLAKALRCEVEWDYTELGKRGLLHLTMAIKPPASHHFACDKKHLLYGEAAGSSGRHEKELREQLIEKLQQGLELCDPANSDCCDHNNWPQYREGTADLYRLTAAAKALDLPLTTLRSAILRKEIDFAMTACGLQLVTLDAVRTWAEGSYRPHD